MSDQTLTIADPIPLAAAIGIPPPSPILTTQISPAESWKITEERAAPATVDGPDIVLTDGESKHICAGGCVIRVLRDDGVAGLEGCCCAGFLLPPLLPLKD